MKAFSKITFVLLACMLCTSFSPRYRYPSPTFDVLYWVETQFMPQVERISEARSVPECTERRGTKCA